MSTKPPRLSVTDVCGRSNYFSKDSAFATVAIPPKLKDWDFATATASGAISSGVVYTADKSANAVIEAGQVTGYNLSPEQIEGVPEVPVECAADRIVRTYAAIARQYEASLEHSRDQSARWFNLMRDAGQWGYLMFFAGVALALSGLWQAGLITVLGGAIATFLARAFYQKDDKLRRTIEKQNDRLQDTCDVLVAFDMASTIEDRNEKIVMKSKIVETVLRMHREVDKPKR